jgi:hypothetical protein
MLHGSIVEKERSITRTADISFQKVIIQRRIPAINSSVGIEAENVTVSVSNKFRITSIVKSVFHSKIIFLFVSCLVIYSESWSIAWTLCIKEFFFKNRARRLEQS